MIKRITLLSLVSFLAFACGTKTDRPEFTEPVFEDKSMLTGSVLNDTFLFSFPRDMFLVDSLLIVRDSQKSTLNIFNKNTGEHLASFANRGRGAGEVLAVSNVNLCGDNSIMIFDSQTKKIVIYDIGKVLGGIIPNYTEFSVENTENVVWSVLPYKNGFILGGNDSRMRYGIYDPISSETHVAYTDFPTLVKDEEENWSAWQYSVNWRVKPDQTKMAVGTYIGMSMAVLDLKDGAITADTLVRMREPLYSISQGVKPKWITHDQTTLFGFRDMYVTDNYIYTIMYPAVPATDRTNLIGVFDWNISPIKQYELDNTILTFAVDEPNNTIYAVEYEDGEIFISKFDMGQS
jgi:hypothetical protein